MDRGLLPVLMSPSRPAGPGMSGDIPQRVQRCSDHATRAVGERNDSGGRRTGTVVAVGGRLCA